MSTPKKLEQLRSMKGAHRKDVYKLLHEIDISYNNCKTIEDKATLLDQLIHVKRNMEKEHNNALLQRHS